ncbi:MAG: PEP-CTERM sorting domain-containing protein [Pseudomonadota bacterium]
MNKQISTLSAAILAMSISTFASADVLVDWDLTDLVGNEAARAANSFAAGLTGNDLLRGAGLTGSTGANALNASGWTGEATDYFSFGFSVGAGYQVDLGSLVIATRSSGTGPGAMGLFYSGNGFSSALYTFNQAPGGNYVNTIVDLGALQDLTGQVEFRIAQIGTASANGGTTGSAGTFRVAEYADGINYTNLQLNGVVAAPVPEADVYAMMLAGLGLLGFAARRRKG